MALGPGTCESWGEMPFHVPSVKVMPLKGMRVTGYKVIGEPWMEEV